MAKSAVTSALGTMLFKKYLKILLNPIVGYEKINLSAERISAEKNESTMQARTLLLKR